MTIAAQQQSPDKLDGIFALQTELNDYVFRNNNIIKADGTSLTMADITAAASAGQLLANELPNQWLSRYGQAIEAELKELKDDLRWKWWSKDRIDLQNIRVELVDILHFLVSAMISAGLTAEAVHDLYKKKHAVNVKRQDAGYSQETKTEEDNRGIQ